MCLSLPLILHNLPIIFKTLTENLDIQESWDLIMTVLRDTGEEAFKIFLSNIERLIANIDDSFDNLKFKRLFAAIATFL